MTILFGIRTTLCRHMYQVRRGTSNRFKKKKDLSSATITKNIELSSKVHELERELQVWKIARNATQDEVDRSKKDFQTEKLMLEQRIAALEVNNVCFSFLDASLHLEADVHLLAFHGALYYRWRQQPFRRPTSK